MNFQKLRRIDKYVGVPLCLFLSLWHRLWTPFRPSHVENSVPRKIIFIKLIEQGSTILAFDALRRACDLVGRENVYFYVFEENRFPLELLNLIPQSNIFCVETKSLVGFARDIVKSLWQVRRAKIDTLIDLEFFARGSAILAYLTGVPRRIGLHRFTADAPYRGSLMTHRVQYNSYIHTAQFFRLLVEVSLRSSNEIPLAKIPVPPMPQVLPRFEPTAQDLDTLKNKLQRLNSKILTGPIVLLNANASDLLPIRKWEGTRYIDLTRRLLQDFPSAHILFTGAPNEKEKTDTLVTAIADPRAISVAGLTTFRELFVLYSVADALVTNDSGPGHFSSMTDVFAITLFGPETPDLYGALGAQKIAISQRLACSPCVNVYNHRFSPCNNNVCMQQITVDQVYAHLKPALLKRGGSHAA